MSGDSSILITGCSSGIGRCIALGLSKRGYRVFATVRAQDDVAALDQLGLESMQLDLNSSESISRAVIEILQRTDGKLFALINNGAYGQVGAVEDLSRDVLRAQLETNLLGTHELTTQLMPVFHKQNRGRIIQISSILGLVCLPYRGAYQASKYALEGLSDTMRLELHGSGIWISLVEPGPIKSQFRVNALKYFKANIDSSNSTSHEHYEAAEKRLLSDQEVPFTLPPEAVLKKVVHALESEKPKTRYLVTTPAHLLARISRIIPDRWFDALARRIGAD